MGWIPALLAWALSLVVLASEHLPAEWLQRAPNWSPGGREALVLLFFACAACVPRSDGRPLRAAVWMLALALGPLAGAIALDSGNAEQRWPLHLTGLAAATLAAAAGAAAQGRLAWCFVGLVLGVGVGLPLLAAWGETQALGTAARLSPLGWLARSAQGAQAPDGLLAPFGAALIGLALIRGSGEST